MRAGWATVASEICAALAPFDPRTIGTPPLGLDVPGSDIDIACHAPDPDAFGAYVVHRFGREPGYAIRRWRGDGASVICRFERRGWPIEIFGAPEAVAAQTGYRHFAIESRLLALGGKTLHAAVRAARMGGLKTEPAFAAVLGLTGDPYTALLALEPLDDRDLAARVAACAGGDTCASLRSC